MGVASGILYEVTLTIQPTTGGDDGKITGRTTSGSPITVKADRFQWDQAWDEVDHSTGMDEAEMMRNRKMRQSAHLEMKMLMDGLVLAALVAVIGQVVLVTGTCVGGNVVMTYAKVRSVQPEYGSPNTLRVDFSSYGTKWAVTAP